MTIRERRRHSHEGFTINASRVPMRGGLRTYTQSVIECLAERYDGVEAVLPTEMPTPPGITRFEIPTWLSSPFSNSKFRPILWLAYCWLSFPAVRSRRVLTTTHQALPFHRRQILTVHDLRPYFEPDTWMQHFYFRNILPRALRRSDGIITVSETSKQQIVSIFGIHEEKIYVVPNSVTPPLPCHEPAVLQEGPFLLMVGATWKHKNAIEVLDRNALWKSRFRLVIVAGEGPYCNLLRRRSVELGLSDRTRIITDCDERDLRNLYTRCSALIYPSSMEGFGIPPLEAMSYGKLTIVSDIPVFHELFEDAPYFVRLGDPASWGSAFAQLLEPDSESNRRHLELGLAIAAKFTRQRMCSALESALQGIWGLRADTKR